MANINSYLTFNGNCREAMNFYKECLGGELTLQTVGETSLSNPMPEQMKDFILHSTLKSDDIILMASDMAGEKGVQKGNNISLMLTCNSEEHIRIALRNSQQEEDKISRSTKPIGEQYLALLPTSLATNGF